jgi:toxin ParE1/3/4
VKLVILPLALTELHDAAGFYSRMANIELGLAFVAEFERTTSLVLDNPELGTIFRGTRRRFQLRRFPHSIIYQIANEDIRIVALAHHRRRPNYWTDR